MMLKVDDVEFGYSSVPTLHDITFSIDPGDVLSILGPNGVGKTTLLKCLNRILGYRGGSVMVEGQDITLLDKRDIARRMGYVPQRGDVSRMTVFDAVLLGRRPHIEWDATKKDLGITGRVIELLGLEELALKSVDALANLRPLVQRDPVRLPGPSGSHSSLFCGRNRISADPPAKSA